MTEVEVISSRAERDSLESRENRAAVCSTRWHETSVAKR